METITSGQLFTPVHMYSGERARMTISDEDRDALDQSSGQFVWITDLNTNKMWRAVLTGSDAIYG